MGAETCGNCMENKIYDKEIIIYESEDQQQISLRRYLRKGLPSINFAININDLATRYANSDDWSILEKQIFKIQSYEKSKKKTINVNRMQDFQNQLPDPYYIPSLKCFYVGEWIWDDKFNNNIPNGIGRLYDNFEQQVLQGCIKTFIQDNIHEIKNQVAQKFISNISESIEQNKNSNNLVLITLDGEGRRFNRNEEYVGQFKKGELHGKGMCTVIDQQYSYEGMWRNSKKHGQGTEKTKLTSYDGDFVDDKKQGKGSLIFYLSQQQENKRIEEQEQVTKKLQLEEVELRQEASQILKLKKAKRNKLKKNLSKFLWKDIFPIKQSIFEIENFLIDHQLRKIYLQKYVGGFKEDLFEGKGVYCWHKGKVYHGDWVGGRMQGIGQFWWPSGIIYRGQYKNDKRHGLGEMIWEQDIRYRGSWAYGVRHGYGEIIKIQQETEMQMKIQITGAIWNQGKQARILFSEQMPLQHNFKLKTQDVQLEISQIKQLND